MIVKETVGRVAGTDQTAHVKQFGCGCEVWIYSLPGHEDAVYEYPCDEHDD